MSSVVPARDAHGARNAVPIMISPREFASASSELHDATLANEPGFVAIEHTEDVCSGDAIDVADDALAPTARGLHAGIRTKIVEAAPRRRGAEVACMAPQPLGHLDIDGRTQRAIDEQQRIASREP